MKTDTDITMAHTVSVLHGTGAGITAHTTVRSGALTGKTGAIVLGDITVITTHGIMEDSMTHGALAGSMIHGIMEVTGEDITPDTGDGTTHGIITIITDGMTRTITDHLTQEAQPVMETDITDSAVTRSATA